MTDAVETAAFSNTPAWHGAGTVVQGFMSTSEAFTKSGLDWPDGVEKRPLFAPSARFDPNTLPQDLLEANGTPADAALANRDILILRAPIHVPEQFAVVRNMDSSVLGVVGPQYQVIQNVEMFSFLDTLTTGEDKVAKWESAGSLRNGRYVWALLNLAESEIKIGKNDSVLPYLLAYNGHDGSTACRVIPTTVRVVCWNTLSAAIAGNFKDLAVTIRHTGDVGSKLEQGKLLLARAGEMFGAFGKVANELAEKAVDKASFEQIIEELFPMPKAEEGQEPHKPSVARVQNSRDLFGQSLKEEIKLLPVAGPEFSYWTLLNGFTRYADHARVVQTGKRPAAETRFESNMMGSNDWFKQSAAKTVLSIAGIGKN